MIIRKLYRLYSITRKQLFKYWNRIKFMMMGVQCGRNSCVSNRVYITGMGKITIGDNFKFSSGGNINPICRNLRGSIFAMTKNSRIEIGDNVAISSACLWAKERITIGKNVNIGGDCLLLDNDAHPLDYIQRRAVFLQEVGWANYQKTISTGPIEIGDDVWIGTRCIILKGVHIGARSIIAAGSVVVKDIPSDVIAGGNPCKVLKFLK